MLPKINMPFLNAIKRKRLKTNKQNLTGNANNTLLGLIKDFKNTEIIAALKFRYIALRKAEVIIDN
jgi:hypothetical protein